MNNVTLIGRLCKDPEVRTFKSKDGSDVRQATFTLAVDRAGDDADFIRCQAYGKTAELVEEWCEKGQRIGVTGHIRTDSYEHKDGYTVYTTDVIVDRFDFADGKSADANRGNERGCSRARR